MSTISCYELSSLSGNMLYLSSRYVYFINSWYIEYMYFIWTIFRITVTSNGYTTRIQLLFKDLSQILKFSKPRVCFQEEEYFELDGQYAAASQVAMMAHLPHCSLDDRVQR
jgi:hypothetical protein